MYGTVLPKVTNEYFHMAILMLLKTGKKLIHAHFKLKYNSEGHLIEYTVLKN